VPIEVLYAGVSCIETLAAAYLTDVYGRLFAIRRFSGKSASGCLCLACKQKDCPREHDKYVENVEENE